MTCTSLDSTECSGCEQIKCSNIDHEIFKCLSQCNEASSSARAKLNHKLWSNTEKPIKHHNFIPFFRFDRMHSTNHLQLISRFSECNAMERSERSDEEIPIKLETDNKILNAFGLTHYSFNGSFHIALTETTNLLLR